MDYKCVPFDPGADCNAPAATISSKLQDVSRAEATDGWEFAGLENHATVVPGSNGCFGFGATSPYEHTFSIAVFRK